MRFGQRFYRPGVRAALALLLFAAGGCKLPGEEASLQGAAADFCRKIKVLFSPGTLTPSAQKEYEEAFASVVDQGGDMLKMEKSFAEIDSFFARERGQMARNQAAYANSAPLFGVPRIKNEMHQATTPFGAASKYEGGFLRLKEAAQSPTGAYGLKVEEQFGQKMVQVVGNSPTNPHKQYELSGFALYLTAADRQIMLPFMRSIDQPFVAVFHTVPATLLGLKKDLDFLYKEALQSGTPAEVLERVGRFHWWYAHAMPYMRGSAAIGNMHIANLLKHHRLSGFETQMVHRFSQRYGLDLDVWAITSGDSEIYAKAFGDALLSPSKIDLP